MPRKKETSQIRFQQYRIQVVEMWPESLQKQSTLAAAQAALEREVAYTREKFPQRS